MMMYREPEDDEKNMRRRAELCHLGAKIYRLKKRMGGLPTDAIGERITLEQRVEILIDNQRGVIRNLYQRDSAH
jgi:hypothetical protein